MHDMLEVRGLSTGYGNGNILHDVSFRIPEGQVCALLGGNGSGKTTLLRAVCGLMPKQGACFLQGTETGSLSPRRRAEKIAFLSARGGTPLSVGCLELVLMGAWPGLGMLERPSAAQKEKAFALLGRLGVPDCAGRDFTAISKGQQQLVLLARTLLRDTPLTVLDEPDGPLDERRRGIVMAMLRERAERGRTVLLASHDVGWMLRCADRLLLMRDGRITGDVLTASADEAELKAAFRPLYGEVDLLRNGGHYLMDVIL